MSANETRSPHLLRTLHRLINEYKNLGDEIPVNEIFQKLDNYKRAHLVAEDPVVCAVILYRIVTVLMCSKLCAKRKNNPFGRYRVEDYFIRIEFHHRGSPHAHVLPWPENAAVESLSEDLPLTLQTVTDLCSVDERDLEPGGSTNDQKTNACAHFNLHKAGRRAL